MKYVFDVTLSGEGNTPEEAWDNAVEAFVDDPGACPETYTNDEDDEDE